MKYYQQLDITDCGAACISMIASHFGKRLSIAEVRDAAGTDNIGTNINGLLLAASKFGLRATAAKGNRESITKSLITPFIAHLHIEKDKDNWVDHYVVVKHIGDKRITIWNPDPIFKKQKISYEQFFNVWTGYAVFFEPDDCFKISEKKENLLTKFLPIFIPHTKTLIFSLLSSLLLLIFGIVTSFYFKYIFDEVIYSKSTVSLNFLSFGVLIITLFQCIVEMLRNILLSHFNYKIDIQLNFSYLAHIFKLPISFFESRKSGEILSRIEDLEEIQQTLSFIVLSGIMDVIMIVISAPILFNINSKLFLLSFITIIIISTITFCYSKLYKKYYSKSMNQNADVQSYLYESLNGVSTVKALNAEDIVNHEYEKKKMLAVDTSWKLNKFGISQNFINSLIYGISNLLLYWIGCLSIIKGNMSLGTLITFNSLLSYFSNPLFRIIESQNQIQESLVAAERVGEILELDNEKNDSIQYIQPLNIKGHIIFKDVTFFYGSRKPIYEKLNLEISPGSWTAFVGPSGSGKSTLVKLILKFYIPQNGYITLDGTNLNDIDTTCLRSLIGYVPQDIFLFSGTIRDNISLHNSNATLEDIIEVSKKAGAHEFIEKLPKRYETVLGEHGGGLSGGEKQRLALARALLGNPSLIILDEATSNLDTVSEQTIHKTLRQLQKEKISVILIAHRLTTVTNCDKIFVMKEGKIIEQGTHAQLVSKNGLYNKMLRGNS